MQVHKWQRQQHGYQVVHHHTQHIYHTSNLSSVRDHMYMVGIKNITNIFVITKDTIINVIINFCTGSRPCFMSSHTYCQQDKL